jgi:hypothetical protein
MSKVSKMVVLSPDDWRTVVEYLLRAKVPTKRAKEAVEALNAMERAQWMELDIKENE